MYYFVFIFGSNYFCIGYVSCSSMGVGSWNDYGLVICSIDCDNYNVIDFNIVVDDNGIFWMFFGSFWDGIKMVMLNFDGFWLDNFVYLLVLWGGGVIEVFVIVKCCGYYYLFVLFDKCCDGVNSIYNICVGCVISVFGFYIDK